ncbi:MAG: LSU m3Psi1915 methyltransferase RlmH [Candidatus Carbobacillus altaicus]|uniref:Ribosomal RNA large subunit methyltransferase H n=1 Tax=Candidatus Carbonibacillus altaicus TaxID=2163959 RepID=A0A2R6Y484_9BACL|nr:MAG: LSU m3Psi1915 methyltransferase RlmH [Candidatus Carbobacillus altaicus]
MRHTLVAVGKIRASYLNAGVQEYLKRLRVYTRIDIIEVREEKASEHLSTAEQEKIKRLETERLLGRIPKEGIVIALDPRGEALTSEMWGEAFLKWMNAGVAHVSWLIGGSLGLADDMLPRNAKRWSLSSLTFTHGLARLILLEQLYRAYKIGRGEPYHK